MKTYIIYDDPNLARGCSFIAMDSKGSTIFKWSYLVSIDKTESCLILDKKDDYTDIDGTIIKAKCSYNDFINFINTNQTFNTYTEVDVLNDNWNKEI